MYLMAERAWVWGAPAWSRAWLIGVRQIWTVQMGMRGLVITDLVQGIVAYGGSALLCLGLLWFSREASYANLATLPSELRRRGRAASTASGTCPA